MDILHENSGLAVKLLRFSGEPMNIKTLFSNINFWNTAQALTCIVLKT